MAQQCMHAHHHERGCSRDLTTPWRLARLACTGRPSTIADQQTIVRGASKQHPAWCAVPVSRFTAASICRSAPRAAQFHASKSIDPCPAGYIYFRCSVVRHALWLRCAGRARPRAWRGYAVASPSARSCCSSSTRVTTRIHFRGTHSGTQACIDQKVQNRRLDRSASVSIFLSSCCNGVSA
jgi:hypothetical protein